MKKKLLVVGVAAALSALEGVSRTMLLAPPAMYEAPRGSRSTNPWEDGGKHRSMRRYRRHQLSAAARLLESAKSRRVSGL